MALHFHAHAQMPQAAAFMAWLQDHLQAEGVHVQRTPTGLQMHMPQVGMLAFHTLTEHGFACDIAANDGRMAALIQLALDEHAQEFLHDHGERPTALQLRWSGLPAADLQHRFQVARVIAVHDLTPHMRRVRLAAPVMAPWLGDGLHVRLVLPPKDRPGNGRISISKGACNGPRNNPRCRNASTQSAHAMRRPRGWRSISCATTMRPRRMLDRAGTAR